MDNGRSPNGALPASLIAHLQRSGLTSNTITSAYIRAATVHELPPNYRDASAIYIPYFDTHGNPISSYYRLRFLPALRTPKGKVVRYAQPQGSLIHAYLPPIVKPEVWQGNQPLIITEGEKKALAAAQFGFPTIGLGGVDLWRSRRIAVKPTAIKQDKKRAYVTFESQESFERATSKVAPELLDVNWTNRRVFIVFDSPDIETNINVQRAAFELALWLEDQGADPVGVVLPTNGFKPDHKVGLDDYIVKHGPKALQRLLTQYRHTFPIPPDIKRWVQKQLDLPQIKRPTYRRVARAVIAALDKYGSRYVDQTRTYYYFDRRTKVLHDFHLGSGDIRQARLSSLGTLLHDEFGVDTSDSTAVARIADYFTAQEPIGQVRPRRVVATKGDVMYYQVSDSELVRVTADDITIVDNGTDGMLFLSSQVDSPNVSQLRQLLSPTSVNVEGRWVQALSQVNLEPFDGLTIEQSRILLACLFHLNPWLRRWRGLMLPLEMAVAEPNSGKTFLYNLRRGILTGRPSLDNAPSDLRDWYASIASAPGLWVADNLADLSRDLRGKMSDELARLITDPDPSVDMRQLYTTNTVLRVPIDTAFAATAVWNPFFKPDLVQRTLTIRMRAIPAGKRNSTWYQQQLAEREAWLVEHFVAVRNFLHLARTQWNPRYLSGHRLQHYEQSVFLMGQSIGVNSSDMISIVNKMQSITQEAVAQNDPTIAALRVYADERLKDNKPRRIQDIVEWVKFDPEERFMHLTPMRNAVKLGQYFAQHASDIEITCGMEYLRRHNTSYVRKK